MSAAHPNDAYFEPGVDRQFGVAVTSGDGKFREKAMADAGVLGESGEGQAVVRTRVADNYTVEFDRATRSAKVKRDGNPKKFGASRAYAMNYDAIDWGKK